VSKEEKPELASALEEMGLEVCYSETGRKLPANVPDECRIVFVCEQFSGPDYERLVDKKFRYIGWCECCVSSLHNDLYTYGFCLRT
jgi:hypothetical protein